MLDGEMASIDFLAALRKHVVFAFVLALIGALILPSYSLYRVSQVYVSESFVVVNQPTDTQFPYVSSDYYILKGKSKLADVKATSLENRLVWLETSGPTKLDSREKLVSFIEDNSGLFSYAGEVPLGVVPDCKCALNVFAGVVLGFILAALIAFLKESVWDNDYVMGRKTRSEWLAERE